jgi:hypothetical protein
MGDYSCYINITNKLSYPLTFVDKGADWGYWHIDPPTTIGPRAKGSFQLKDSAGKIIRKLHQQTHVFTLNFSSQLLAAARDG